MNDRRIRLSLKVAAGAIVCAGAGLVVTAALWPLQEPLNETAGRQSGSPVLRVSDEVLPLASLAPAWSRDLRRPLTGSPSVPAQQNAPATVLPVRLVGTILDPVRPRGIFVTVRGQMELRAAGEKAGGVDVLSVDERGATVSYAGKSLTLKVERLENPAPLPAVSPNDPPAPPPSARSDAKSEGGEVR